MSKSVSFSKYHGTGNDFVMIDNRDLSIVDLNSDFIRNICHRRFGVGADGLILLQNHKNFDFEMIYYNSDGNPSSMCGNGGRCITAFAKRLGIINDHTLFYAADGIHEASLIDYDEDTYSGFVSLKMADVSSIEKHHDYFILNTGSPHYVCFVNDLMAINVSEEGRKIRNLEPYGREGINVNFVMKKNGGVEVRTYERGVEDETWSCGTGVTAVALVMGVLDPLIRSVKIDTPGGTLEVSFKRNKKGYHQVYLLGPAKAVFDGILQIK